MLPKMLEIAIRNAFPKLNFLSKRGTEMLFYKRISVSAFSRGVSGA